METHQDKIPHLRLAAALIGLGFDPKTLDMLVTLYELIREKKGDTDLKSIAKAQAEVEARHL